MFFRCVAALSVKTRFLHGWLGEHANNTGHVVRKRYPQITFTTLAVCVPKCAIARLLHAVLAHVCLVHRTGSNVFKNKRHTIDMKKHPHSEEGNNVQTFTNFEGFMSLKHCSWLLSLMPSVLLGYGHVACIERTVALLLSLWLSCGGGVFKTFEDVLFSIQELVTTDVGVEAGIPSTDKVVSHFAAVVKRRVSGTCQAYSRLMPGCVHVHDRHHVWADQVWL